MTSTFDVITDVIHQTMSCTRLLLDRHRQTDIQTDRQRQTNTYMWVYFCAIANYTVTCSCIFMFTNWLPVT